MSTGRVIDYYKVLSVPPDADLMGIENAYVRISDELVKQVDLDEGVSRALETVNEAYTVLSNAETRRQYDRILFAREYEALERRLRAAERRNAWVRRILVGALGLIVAFQAGILLYVGGDTVDDAARAVLGPLYPEEAD